MTLFFGTIAGLVLGLALGRTRLSLILAAAIWYVFLTLQTVYLARPGATGFGGSSGTDILRGATYWLAQPLLLVLTLVLLLAGARLRGRVFATRARAGR